MAFAHTGFFTSEPAEALAELVIANAPGDLDGVYLVSGGSEATEAAIKLARQYFVEVGEPQRTRIIARRQSYHGDTQGAFPQVATNRVEPSSDPCCWTSAIVHPDTNTGCATPGETALEYGQRAAQELEDENLR